jgi:hypothetical protein
LKAGPELRPRAQALEVLRKLAASSDANLGALRAAGALGALLALLAAAPPASGRAAGAVHLLRDLALYAPADRCALERLWAALRDESAISSTAAVHAQGPGMLWRGSPSVCALTLATAVARRGNSANVAVRVQPQIPLMLAIALGNCLHRQALFCTPLATMLSCGAPPRSAY